ncbi:protein GET1-like isoform X2 [Mangifera indica]|uniref:protein GET1-like isoform X2 n=1 Tax=Mangifera indica TaxID=29780 RepID=UPI001CFA5633|nr:protein GET1-like isoform X2 [Mangifera indica]
MVMREEEIIGKQESPLAAPLILLIVFAFQYVSRWVQQRKMKGYRSDKEMQLRGEIKQILKEASSLSQPSTFAQAVKLRRLAAAKEKEIANHKELQCREIKSSYDLYLKVLSISKVVVYFVLICWFWRTPIAAVSRPLVQPFGWDYTLAYIVHQG